VTCLIKEGRVPHRDDKEGGEKGGGGGGGERRVSGANRASDRNMGRLKRQNVF